jgi:hypothetical protein
VKLLVSSKRFGIIEMDMGKEISTGVLIMYEYS